VVHPLVAAGGPYCFGLPFAEADVLPRPLDIDGRDGLDAEDAVQLLRLDAVATTFALLPLLRDRVPLTDLAAQRRDMSLAVTDSALTQYRREGAFDRVPRSTAGGPP
jgi:hypothetical protein